MRGPCRPPSALPKIDPRQLRHQSALSALARAGNLFSRDLNYEQKSVASVHVNAILAQFPSVPNLMELEYWYYSGKDGQMLSLGGDGVNIPLQ